MKLIWNLKICPKGHTHNALYEVSIMAADIGSLTLKKVMKISIRFN